MIDPNDLKMIVDSISMETGDKDTASSLTHVLINRMKQPEKFGLTLPEILAGQFSNAKLDNQPDEDSYKQVYASVGNTLRGNIEDKTGGATHFSRKGTKLDSIFEKTHSTGSHNFFKETQQVIKSAPKSRRKTLR